MSYIAQPGTHARRLLEVLRTVPRGQVISTAVLGKYGNVPRNDVKRALESALKAGFCKFKLGAAPSPNGLPVRLWWATDYGRASDFGRGIDVDDSIDDSGPWSDPLPFRYPPNVPNSIFDVPKLIDLTSSMRARLSLYADLEMLQALEAELCRDVRGALKRIDDAVRARGEEISPAPRSPL